MTGCGWGLPASAGPCESSAMGAQGFQVECPGCGQDLTVAGDQAGGALQCMRCGQAFEVAAPAEPPQRACPFCAEPIRADAVKCRHCGEFLDGSARPAPPSVEVKKSEGLFLQTMNLGCAVVILLIALVFIAMCAAPK